MNLQPIIFFTLWIDILQELFPGSLWEQFPEKEDEYLWRQEIFTEQELIVDSTEQIIYRADDGNKQKKYYCGKKKSHTWKNQIITTERGTEIVDVIVGKRGSESDVNLLRQQPKKFDREQKFQGDKGEQGAERITIPKKKPLKQELPPKIQEENQKKSQQRIFVDHVIRLIKILGVARERFRLKDSNNEKIILTICGLVRLRRGAFILV